MISLSLNKLFDNVKEKQIKIIYKCLNILQHKNAILEELIKIVKTTCSQFITSILICFKDMNMDKIKRIKGF